jgi:hypothetical protein
VTDPGKCTCQNRELVQSRDDVSGATLASFELRPAVPPAPLRLDLGCGPNKKVGWFGVDSRPFPGVDLVFDLAEPHFAGAAGCKYWPWLDNSVEEVQALHVVEHLTPSQRVHFVNQLYRVLKPGAKALIVTPHWASCRAYGDLTHQWPPVCEMWFAYLSAAWRAKEAPHNDQYMCDFTSTYGYGVNPKLQSRADEFRQWALEFYKESAMDLVATLTKPLTDKDTA